MNSIKNLFILLWKSWLFILVFTSIILLIPIVAIIISRDKWLPIYSKIARRWAKTILLLTGFTTEIEMEEVPSKNNNYVFCPNHTSMIDILIMFSITKIPFAFVGKKELAKLPFIGYIYKRTCILVDRNNQNSKIAVFEAAKNSIDNKLSLCIFPEGKVPDDESIVLDSFHNGAFRLAIENKMPIVPISIYDSKKRFSYTFFSGGPGKLRVKIHKFIPTENFEVNEKNRLKNKTHHIIYNSLATDKSYMKSSCK